MKCILKIASLAFCFAVAMTLFSCSNGSDGGGALMALAATSGGGTNPMPTTTATYTITFNANDGSQSPATATQTFTAGTPQALRTIVELGFKKDGFNFAGWGISSDASESSYADGASYTATTAATLYALWSSVPVYNVLCASSPNNGGTVNATPATGIAGTEIMLSNSPTEGYQFVSYSVTDAESNEITVTNGKFIMPEKHVAVTANFSAINYTITCNASEHGNVKANCLTATIGASVTLTLDPDSGYRRKTIVVNKADDSNVAVIGKGNERSFIMPAQNVTVNATFAIVPPEPSGEYTELPAGTTDGTYGTGGSYVTFGLWPQSVADDDVIVNENENKTVGAFVFCKGDDGAWYVKVKVCYDGGTTYLKVHEDMWFKVEPVKWRVVTTDYNGKKLLLAENILYSGIPFYLEAKDTTRTIGGKVIYPNNYKYSTIRAYLNGSYEEGDSQTKTYTNKGFLQTAFTSNEQEKILKITLDNSVNTIINTGDCIIQPAETYVCDDTDDKIFLLSESEITNDKYGFENNVYLDDNARLRIPTDFAVANNMQGRNWWLRSPSNDKPYTARKVAWETATFYLSWVDDWSPGIVPALCVSN